MPEQRTVMFEGKPNVFPADFTDAEISAALGAIPASNAASVPKARTWVDTAVNAIPKVTGTAGAIIGGAGGTAFGLGFGGIPGAAGGAALGAGAGEAAKQLINRARGADAPATSGEAASQIAIPAAEAGVTTGALGLAGKAASAVYPSVVKGAAKAVDSLSPDIVGLVSPRAAHALKMAQKAISIAESQLPSDAPKLAIDARKYIQIKALMDQGIPQGEAVKTVMNLHVKGMLQ
jgi:hypothetical protein